MQNIFLYGIIISLIIQHLVFFNLKLVELFMQAMVR